MICPNCQKETPAGNCCMHCGAVLNQNSQSIPSVTTNNANQPQKKKSKLGTVLTILAIIVVVIGIIAKVVPAGPTGYAVLELKEEDGSVATMTYYYKNDVVYKMIDSYTLAYPEGLDETTADLLQAQLDIEFAAAKGLSYCTVAYTHDEKSFTVTVTYTDLDNATTLKALEQAKLIETSGGNDGDLVSYKISKNGLISEGYTLVSENNE